MKSHYNSRLLHWFPEGTKAFTFGEHVFFADGLPSQALELHEAMHVQQFRRLGIPRFLLTYFWHTLRRGYAGNPLEIEARDFAAQRMAQCSFLDNVAFLVRFSSLHSRDGGSPDSAFGNIERTPKSRP